MSSSSAATNSSIPSAKLSNGQMIPMLAYGTGTAHFKTHNLDQIHRPTVDAIKTALALGFYHLDCAELYNTEAEVGLAIQESGLPRSQLFITTKVITHINDIPAALTASLHKLGLDFVDLYLIHSPWFASSPADLQTAWAAMEAVQRAGKTRAIGVSSFLQPHLEALLATATIPPVLNQVEFHPYLQRGGLLPFCRARGIMLAAFGPLAPVRKARPGPCDAVLGDLAKRYSVGEEAVALRWCLDQGVLAVTTSGKKERLRGYLGATRFRLTDGEVEEICRRGSEMHWRENHFMHQFTEDDRS